jgi:hypothetical protein
MSKSVREPVRPFAIQLNPAVLRQAEIAKASGRDSGDRAARAKAMPNGDPPPLMLWGSEKG